MALTPYAPGASRQSSQMFVSMRRELDDLQRQLATGKKSDDYAGLGLGRAPSLDARAKLAAIQGYASVISDAEFRVKLMSTGIDSLSKASSALTGILQAGRYDVQGSDRNLAQLTAEQNLQMAIDVLNQDVAGRYLYSGRATTTKPIGYDAATLLDGTGSAAGLRTLISERKQADAGDGLGRLALTAPSATSVSLAETASGPFGFTIAAATSSNAGAIAVTNAAGPPVSASFSVGGTPVAGDTIRVTLGLPDGTQAQIQLTARSTADASDATGFPIGATAADTATNLQAALDAAVREQTGSSLAAASAMLAGADFFSGTVNNPPPRIAPPPATATAFTPSDPLDPAFRETVRFYQGDDSVVVGENATVTARASAPVRVDTTQTVGVGARADEPAFRNMLIGFGVLAAETFSIDPAQQALESKRASALGARASDALTTEPGDIGLASLAVDLGNASASMASAKERHNAGKLILEDTVAGIENASTEEVAAAILALQTRMQASYQVTSILSNLSLVNYL